MNNLFRSSKSSILSSKSRNSAEPSSGELGITSIPYEKISSNGSGPRTVGARKHVSSTSIDRDSTISKRDIGPPIDNPGLSRSSGTSIGTANDATIHDYFARTAGDRAQAVGRFSRSPDVEEDFGTIHRNPSASSSSNVSKLSASRQLSTGSRLAVLREGAVSPSPTIASPPMSHRRRDSNSVNSVDLAPDLTRYPKDNGSIGSRSINSTSTLNAGMYNNLGHATSSVSLLSSGQDDFDMERPSDPNKIEAMFTELLATMDFPADNPSPNFRPSVKSSSAREKPSMNVSEHYNIRNMDTDKKWAMIVNNRKALAESKKRQQLTPPEWYMQRLMNGSLNIKDLTGLEVMLRTSKADLIAQWVQDFLWGWQGVSMLSNALATINKNLPTARDPLALQEEYLHLRCLTHLARVPGVVPHIVEKPSVLHALQSSLLSTNIQSRKLAADMLISSVYSKPPIGYDSVLKAFGTYEQMLQKHEKGVNRFASWLKAFEITIGNRGVMGSMVGAGSELRRSNTHSEPINDTNLIEYALSNMLLINGILNVRHGQNSGSSTGLNRRLHIRIEMIHAGLDSIIPKLKKFHDDKLEREIKTYQEVYDEDVKEQQYRLQNDALKSLGDIPEIFSSLTSQMKGTAAEPHFMSILQHFTLIEGQPEQRAKHYKLINQLVTAITMDGQMGTDKDFSAQTGVTVRTMFSRFETEASLDTALSEIDELEKKLARSERHREELKSELAQADGGLVGELKAQLKQTEERLRVSRNNATSLEEDHETMRQEAIASADDLRLDVYELIEMLIETDKLNNVIDKTGRYRKNRRILLKKYEEQQERAETIQLLEGKSRSKRTSSIQLQNFDDIGDDDDISDGSQEVVVRKADKVKVGSARRKTTFGLPSPPIRTGSERLSGSQFVDADDDNVKAHIEARLMSEDPSPIRAKGSLPRSARSRNVNLDTLVSPRAGSNLLTPPPIGRKSRDRYNGNLAKHPGFSNVLDEMRTRSIVRSASAPANMEVDDDDTETMISQRESGFSQVTAHTAMTSISSMHSRSDSGTGKSLAEQLSQKAKGLGLSHEDTVKEDMTLSTVPEDEIEQVDEDHPPPPTPPPLPVHLGGKVTVEDNDESGSPPPPPPPPPPPMPGRTAFGGPGIPSGLLAGIASGIKLRKVDSDTDSVGPPDGPPPPPPPPAPAPPLFRRHSKLVSGGQFAGMNDRRKDVPLTATRKMKQLQWEKVNKSNLDKTVWGQTGQLPQEEWAMQLKRVDVWSEMEDEFKAREVAYDAVAKRKKEELKSVLEPSVRKHVEILMNRTKRLEPEQLCERILAFDKELCNNNFLSELNNLLPTPEQVSLLKQHSAETPEELALLHPADRLMLRLIKIPHLSDRVTGMLYQVSFEETITLLEKGVILLQVACHDLRDAVQFKALLNVILMMGNYMNGSNYGGGAYGFKIASINRLVDTKSSNGQNLLHFLEKTISTQFPEMLEFRKELEKPAEAYRVSLEEVSTGARDLHNGLQKIRRDLEGRFLDANDGYAKRMFPFSATAEGRVDALRDQVQAGIRSFNEVKMYYGEGDDKYNAASNPLALGRPTSLEFFGVFKTFLVSYDLCRSQNKARDDARAALERRRQAERNRAAMLTPQTTGASLADSLGAIDDLHARLRSQGTPRAKRSDRRRARDMPSTPSLGSFDGATFAIEDFDSGDATGLSLADMAAKMLNDLEIESPTPSRRPLATPTAIQEDSEGESSATLQEDESLNDLEDQLVLPATPNERLPTSAFFTRSHEVNPVTPPSNLNTPDITITPTHHHSRDNSLEGSDI